jgi:tetratricopeptide (TPR) repeat protein
MSRSKEPDGSHSRAWLAAVVEAVLTGLRIGNLGELVRRHPGLTRRVLRRYEPWMVELQSPSLLLDDTLEHAARTLTIWAITQLRPDRAATLQDVAREAWLDLSPWRPMLAVACHAGLLPVPEFRERYRRGAHEGAVDNLCGLWGIGTSTFYRHLDRGKQRLVEVLLDWPLAVPRRLALRRVDQDRLLDRLGLPDGPSRIDWHRQLAAANRIAGDPASALWHAMQAGDTPGFIDTLRGHALELAGQPETDAMVQRVAASNLGEPQKFDLLLARAALHRNRHAQDKELECLEEAQRVAQLAGNARLLGRAHGALGKFHEPRDVDRAFAYYESSVRFFQDSGADAPAAGGDDPDELSDYVTTLVRLAWLYVLRNDPRAKAVLDEADTLVHERRVAAEVTGMLEQTWGEYWRRAGDTGRAIAAKHRALVIFERIGDRRSVLVTHLNLVSLFWEAKDFDRAIQAAQPIWDAAAKGPVEPAILASTHINLGVTLYWKGCVDDAAMQYEKALDVSLRAGLRLQANRAHFNLAELFYKRFAESHDPAHEQRADAHIAAMLGAPSNEITPAMVEAARKLKAEVLGSGATTGAENRLLPMEAAIHTAAMAEIGRHRSLLALPVPPEEHARARLAIVAAYQAIAQQEYQAAMQHLQAHKLESRFGAQLLRLRAGSAHASADKERALAQAWTSRAADLAPEELRSAVVAHLLREGAINKSAYAELCGVSPATASKHLAALTERGLLVQTGKGPATRYRLP